MYIYNMKVFFKMVAQKACETDIFFENIFLRKKHWNSVFILGQA